MFHLPHRPKMGAALLGLLPLLAALGLLSAASVSATDGRHTEIAPGASGFDYVSRTIIIPVYPGYPIPGQLVPCFWHGNPPLPLPTGVPTPAPRPTPTPGPATALTYRVCPQLTNRVPPAVQQDALLTPWLFHGYGLRLNPSVPWHPLWNPYRTRLTLLDFGKPWSPCNPVVWKAGCP